MAPKLRKRIRNKLFAPCRSRSDASSNQPARISQPQAQRQASPIPEEAFPTPATAKPWKSNLAGSEYSQSIRAPLRVVNPSSSTYSVDTDLPPTSAVSEKPPRSAAFENKASVTATTRAAPTESNGQNASVRNPQPPTIQGLVAASPDPDELSTTAPDHRNPLDDPTSTTKSSQPKARLDALRSHPVDSPFAGTFPDGIASTTAQALQAAAESVEELRAALELDPAGIDDSTSQKPPSNHIDDDSTSTYSKAPSEPSSFVSVPLTVGDANAVPCQPDSPFTHSPPQDVSPDAPSLAPESDQKVVSSTQEKEDPPKVTATVDDSASSYSRTTGEPSHQDDVAHDDLTSVDQALIDAQLMREIEQHLSPSLSSSADSKRNLQTAPEPLSESAPMVTEKPVTTGPTLEPAPAISDDFLAGPFHIETPVPTFFAELTLRPAPQPMKAFTIENPGLEDEAACPALQPAVTDDELRSTTPASIRSSIADEDLPGLQVPGDSSSRYDSAAGEDEGSPDVTKSPEDKNSLHVQSPTQHPQETESPDDKISPSNEPQVDTEAPPEEKTSADDNSSESSSLNGPTLVEIVEREVVEEAAEPQSVIEGKDEEQPSPEPAPAQTPTLPPADFSALETIKEEESPVQQPEEPTATTAPTGPFSSVFSSDTYTAWEINGGLLAIRGAPGAGKSTLITRIGEAFLNQVADGESQDSIASYTFHGVAEQMDARNNTKSGKVVTAMLHALVHQLMQGRGELAEAYSHAEERGWDLSDTELQDILLKHVRAKYHTKDGKEKRKLWVFIDAVDEVGENAAREIFDFFARLSAPRKSHGGLSPVNVCLACRSGSSPLQDTGHKLLQLNAEDFNGDDLTAYLHSELTHLLAHLSAEDAEKASQVIQERAQGVFLWAILAVDLIRRSSQATSLDDVLQQISRAPTDLEEVYQQRIANIPESERARCARLLQWVCFATRPLTLRELRVALVLDPSRAEIKSLQDLRSARDYIPSDKAMAATIPELTRGLLHANPDTATVAPLHESIKSFLAARGIDLLCNQPQGTAARTTDVHISRACLAYIAFPEYHQRHKAPGPPPPLASYVTACWHLHAELAERRGAQQGDLLDTLHSPAGSLNFRMWWRHYARMSSQAHPVAEEEEEEEVIDDRLTELLVHHTASPPTVFDLAAACGLCSTIGAALAAISETLAASPSMSAAEKEASGMTDATERTLLHWAAFSGDARVVAFFLARGDVGVAAVDRRRQTALHIAVIQGHAETAAMLLASPGCVVDARDEDGRAPLHYAALLGEARVARLLLGAGADVNVRDALGRTPLFAPCRAGDAGVVGALLERADANVNARDEMGRTVLHTAVAQRKWGVVCKLLERSDLDVNARDRAGWTALMLAVRMTDVGIVEALMGRGDLDVNAKRDGLGFVGPLLTAVGMRNEALVRVLLRRGDLDVNARGELWRTPLLLAVGKGDVEVVRLLLERMDLDVNARDVDGCTALMDAISAGNEAIVEMLLGRADADVYGKSVSGFVLLSMAEESGNEAVVRLMRERYHNC